jgi:hypothetical protein
MPNYAREDKLVVHENKMARKVKKNHYLASSPTESMSPVEVHRGVASTTRYVCIQAHYFI